MATLSRFSFSAFGTTREEVTEKLDALCDGLIQTEGGEPWLTTQDEVKKTCIDPKDLLNLKSWIYVGERSVLFAGPTPLEKQDDSFRDGFRPQA